MKRFKNFLYILMIFSFVFIGLINLNLFDFNNLRQILSDFHKNNSVDIIFWNSDLPRYVVSLIAGSALSLAGLLFQESTRNVLASPNLLGVGAGAHLSLALGLIFFPNLMVNYNIFFALAGAFIVTVIVYYASSRSDNALRIVLLGVALTFTLNSLAGIISLYFEKDVSGLFLWGAGDLEQQGWNKIILLFPIVLLIYVICFFITQKLKVFNLGEIRATSLGINVIRFRWTLLILGVILTAIAVTLAGPISFIGLFVPNVLRVLKVKMNKKFIFLTAFLGSNVLLFADTLTKLFAKNLYINIPVGIFTAVIGAPTLFWAVFKIRQFSISHNEERATSNKYFLSPHSIIYLSIFFFCILFVFVDGFGSFHFVINFLFNHSALSNTFVYEELIYPRILIAFIAGGSLGVSGLFFQGVIKNNLASPEILGVSQGAIFLVLIFLLFFPNLDWIFIQFITFTGGLIVFGFIMFCAKKYNLQTIKLAMIGICIGAFLTSLNTGLLAFSGMQSAEVIRWSSGSLYGHSYGDLYRLCLILFFTIPISYYFSNKLPFFLLDKHKSISLGFNLFKIQIILLLLATIQTSAVISTIGLLGFIGLIAPHIIKLLGYIKPRVQFVLVFFLGGILGMFSECLSRWLFYPAEIPAGLITPIIGTLYLIWALVKQRVE